MTSPPVSNATGLLARAPITQDESLKESQLEVTDAHETHHMKRPYGSHALRESIARARDLNVGADQSPPCSAKLSKDKHAARRVAEREIAYSGA